MILIVLLYLEKYNFDINYQLGLAYTMLNDFSSAKEFYEKAAEIQDTTSILPDYAFKDSDSALGTSFY